ncbi:DUF397 domain-containing protein [Streptomyces sp. NPDC055078]
MRLAPEGAWFKSSYSGDTGNSCVEVAELPPDSAWFKSTYSGGTGDSCIEVAELTDPWVKSSHSGGTGNNCVEVATLPHLVGIRDSKDKQGPALVVPSAAWSSFVTFAVATG